MKKIPVKDIQGNEILDRDIYSETSNLVVMNAGSVLKKEYVENLEELNIKEVWIKDELSFILEELGVTQDQEMDHCEKLIQDTLYKISYSIAPEYDDMLEAAIEIMERILSEPDILLSVTKVHRESEELYSHLMSVVAISILIAYRLEYDKKHIMEIAIGAILHDIGLIRTCLNKDEKGRLDLSLNDIDNPDIKKHVIYGYSEIDGKEWATETVKDIVLHHHERSDCSGFPYKIGKDRIKKDTMIVAIADVFDSMCYGICTVKRKVHEAIEYIVNCADLKFDKNLVDVFVEAVAPYPIGTIVITNENESGVVIKQNYKNPTRPVIKMINTAKEIDLMTNHTILIKDSV